MKYLPSRFGLILIFMCVQITHATSLQKFVFSNLHFVEESGDLVGTVVCLKTSGENITGTLIDIEGEEPVSATVNGTKKGGEVLFQGKPPYGTASFRGKIDHHMLIGTIIRNLGNGTEHTEVLRLNSASAKSKAATFCNVHVPDTSNR